MQNSLRCLAAQHPIQTDELARRVEQNTSKANNVIALRRPQAPTPGLNTHLPSVQVAHPRKQREESVPGMPGVRKVTYRETGKQTYVIRYRDPVTGRRTCKTVGDAGRMSLVDVALALDAIRALVRQGRSPGEKTPTVDEFFHGAYLLWARAHKRSWKDDASRYALYLQAPLGSAFLDRITTRDLQRVLTELRSASSPVRSERLTNATVNRVAMLLRAIFREAVEAGHIHASPAAGLRLLKENPPSPRALDPEELARLGRQLDAAPPQLRLLIQFLLCTALRIGEALNARFMDVDHKRCILHLPNTKAGEHQTIPLSPAALQVIAELDACRRNDYLFPAQRGDGPMSPPRKALSKLLEEAGVEDAGFHRFRKTAATEAMACEGVDLLTVSRLLRHRSIRTTERHYLATSERRLHHAVAAVGNTFHKHLHWHRPTRTALSPSVHCISITAAARFVTCQPTSPAETVSRRV